MSDDRTSRGALAAEQLCGALWDALHEAVRTGDDAEAVSLSRRLAEVCGAVVDLIEVGAHPYARPPERAASSSAPFLGESDEPVSPPTRRAPRAAADAGARVGRQAAPVERGSDVGGVRREATVVDEQATGETVGDERRDGRVAGDAQVIDERGPIAASAAIVDIRDVRGDDDAPWTVAVQRRLKRYEEDGDPFVVMLVAALDFDSLQGLRRDRGVEEMTVAFEQTIVGELRPADVLMREREGRYWLLAPGTDGHAAHALAARIETAVRFAGGGHGARLAVAFGIAVCPDDGQDARTLLSYADVDLYAAQSKGLRRRGLEWDGRPSRDDRPLYDDRPSWDDRPSPA